MARLLFPSSMLRPLTRLGRFASRPLLPTTSSLRSSARSPFRSPSPGEQRALFSSFNNEGGSNSSSRPSSPQPMDKLPENATITERLKFTIKKYGWYALGMYIFFSTLDFSLTFAAVDYLGADYAQQLMESVKEYLPAIFHSAPADPSEPVSSGGGREGLYAILVITYTIHKTLFLPFRVGLTAAVTPRFVRWLGQKGWHGKEGTKRAVEEARQRMRRSPSRDSMRSGSSDRSGPNV